MAVVRAIATQFNVPTYSGVMPQSKSFRSHSRVAIDVLCSLRLKYAPE